MREPTGPIPKVRKSAHRQPDRGEDAEQREGRDSGEGCLAPGEQTTEPGSFGPRVRSGFQVSPRPLDDAGQEQDKEADDQQDKHRAREPEWQSKQGRDGVEDLKGDP